MSAGAREATVEVLRAALAVGAGAEHGEAVATLGQEAVDNHTIEACNDERLAANEHVAFLKLKEWKQSGELILSQRSQLLAVYALTGFANFASVGEPESPLKTPRYARPGTAANVCVLSVLPLLSR